MAAAFTGDKDQTLVLLDRVEKRGKTSPLLSFHLFRCCLPATAAAAEDDDTASASEYSAPASIRHVSFTKRSTKRSAERSVTMPKGGDTKEAQTDDVDEESMEVVLLPMPSTAGENDDDDDNPIPNMESTTAAAAARPQQEANAPAAAPPMIKGGGVILEIWKMIFSLFLFDFVYNKKRKLLVQDSSNKNDDRVSN